MAEDLERWSRGEPIEGRSARRLERAWRWCRREPRLASMTSGLFLLLTAVAVLALILYQQEKARVVKAQREKKGQQNLLMKRIEKELGEGRAFVRISADELAAFTGREEVTDGAEEVPVVLGLHSNLRQPDQFLQNCGPLVNYLYTNRATVARPRLVLELQIYTSRFNANEGLIKGEIDLMRMDPAVYVLARQGTNQLIPLVQEVYGDGQPEMGAAIFTRTNSEIDDVRQLNGKSFAFGEAYSALGDLLAKAELVANGLHIGDFQSVTNVHSDAVLATVGGGPWDVGVTSMDHISSLAKPGGPFKILKELRSPSYPWVATKKLDPKIAEVITNALLSLRDSNVMARLDYQLTGFRPTRSFDYDALALEMEKAKLFDQPR
jgi:phosphonate transport system substrate-binding protein